MNTVYTDYAQLPLMLNANELAQVLRISRANAYALMHSQDVSIVQIGKRMLISKEELLRYLKENTSKLR